MERRKAIAGVDALELLTESQRKKYCHAALTPICRPFTCEGRKVRMPANTRDQVIVQYNAKRENVTGTCTVDVEDADARL